MNNTSKIIPFDQPQHSMHDIGDSVVVSLKEGNGMDEFLKTYIEKVDRDQDALREDIRESERRTEKRIEDSERRMDMRLDRIEKMIEDQNNKLDGIRNTVNDKMAENKRFMWGIVITILLSIITSIGVIVATYMQTISLLQNML